MSGTERAHAPTWRAVRRAGMAHMAGGFLRVWLQIAGIWPGRAAGPVGAAAHPSERRRTGDDDERAGDRGFAGVPATGPSHQTGAHRRHRRAARGSCCCQDVLALSVLPLAFTGLTWLGW